MPEATPQQKSNRLRYMTSVVVGRLAPANEESVSSGRGGLDHLLVIEGRETLQSIEKFDFLRRYSRHGNPRPVAPTEKPKRILRPWSRRSSAYRDLTQFRPLDVVGFTVGFELFYSLFVDYPGALRPAAK